jgi:hypothetical protein
MVEGEFILGGNEKSAANATLHLNWGLILDDLQIQFGQEPS